MIQKFNIDDFPSTPSIIVYKPNERIFLLTRIAEGGGVENKIKLCGAELKILLLIVGHELKNTGIKVIPLIVTDKKSKSLDCRCRSFLITRKGIVNIEFFMSWYKQKSKDFDITSEDCFEENIANEIFAKVVSCMGATKIHDIFPTFTTKKENQMKGALLLLTPEQIDILHSENKHIIIDGPYGSGKSIIGRAKIKAIAENLPKNELLLYYISYDSRSPLLNEMKRNYPKINIYPDKEEQKGIKLSDMVKNILKRNTMESHKSNEKNDEGYKKLNLIIDEFHGEKLDKSEAHTLNSFINTEYKKIFQDAVVLLISQSMKKKRWTNGDNIDGNRFDLLEQMEKKTLSLVMRKSIQIHNLPEVTKKVLQSVTTRYKLEKKERTDFQEGK